MKRNGSLLPMQTARWGWHIHTAGIQSRQSEMWAVDSARSESSRGWGKRKQRGCWNGKHKLSWGKTVDTGLENEEQRREGCREHMVQLCAGEGQGAVRNREHGGTGLCMVSFQG